MVSSSLMVLVQASKLTLPNPSLSSPQITSVLFEPSSLSLSLMHSDSSFSLYPSFSPLSSSSLPSPQMQIPSPSSSSTFLLLQSSKPNSSSRVLFVVCGPHRAGSEILLRFYILQKSKLFARAQVVCTQKDLRFEPKLGVLVNVKHGVSIKLAGSINYFAMYSVSSSKIWVFAVKMEGHDEDDDGVVVKLMRCAVIECEKPVWSVSISFGLLLLGEENGIRVLSLRRLVKGRVKKVKNLKSDGRGLPLPNGVIANDSGKHGVRVRGGKNYGVEGISEVICNGDVEGKIEKHLVSVKPTNVRFRQDDRDGGGCFVALKKNNVETKSMTKVLTSVKAISIQALSQRMFLILDSAGDLHLLCLSSSGIGSDIAGHIRQLPHTIKVQNMAVLPDASSKSQTVWISDGYHSVHVLDTVDMDNALNATDGSNGDEKLLPLSVVEVIFSSEKIQDVISLASNAILILGQVYMHMQFPEVVKTFLSFSVEEITIPGSLAIQCLLMSSGINGILQGAVVASLNCASSRYQSCSRLAGQWDRLNTCEVLHSEAQNLSDISKPTILCLLCTSNFILAELTSCGHLFGG